MTFSPLLARPFVGLHDFNGVFYGNIGRNYLRFDITKTKLGQVKSKLFLSRYTEIVLKDNK